MENGKSVSDQGEVVRKLQEKVRDLELQLSQKASAASINGLKDTANSDREIAKDEDEDLVPVYDVDLSPKTWLVNSQVDSRSERDLFANLLRDGGFQEKNLYAAICNAEQDRRKSIDSRTFTRSKKRMGRPSLELLDSLSRPESKFAWATEANGSELDNMTCSLLESSLIKSMYSSDASICDVSSQLSVVNKKQKIAPQSEVRRGSLVISDGSECDPEDLVPHFKHDNGNLSYKGGNVHFSDFDVLPPKDDIADSEDINATLLQSSDFGTSLIDSTLMDAGLMDSVILNTKSKMGTSRVHQMNRTFTPSPPTVESSLRKTSNEIIGHNHTLNDGYNSFNNTFVKDEESSGVNKTFCLGPNESDSSQRNGPPLPRPGSTDSGGADDDQLSSTSESSHTSNTRLMSVGDVQHIARLQEESLVISTPIHRSFPKLLEYGETLSPILQANGPDCSRSSGSSEVQTGGYASDHSSRSPLSSLHSSPAGSPFGSSTALPVSTQSQETRLAYRPNSVLQRKSTYGLIPPGKIKERGLRPPAPVTTNPSRPTGRPGLRPPMIRSGLTASSSLPRPAGTGIPRPSSLSRIPPPNVRPPGALRKEWTDECY